MASMTSNAAMLIRQMAAKAQEADNNVRQASKPSTAAGGPAGWSPSPSPSEYVSPTASMTRNSALIFRQVSSTLPGNQSPQLELGPAAGDLVRMRTQSDISRPSVSTPRVISVSTTPRGSGSQSLLSHQESLR